MHMPGTQVSKSMHPAAKMCTPGAGCTPNFEHCRRIILVTTKHELRDLSVYYLDQLDLNKHSLL